MKTALAAIFAFALSLNLAAKSDQTTQASSPRTDLAAMLTDADNVVSATNTDLANLNIDKWSSGWKTGFTKKSSHKKDAQQTADSVKQLAGTLPGMIAEVRSLHGNVGSTFKLYNSLTQVCENMNPLVEATQTYGKKEEYNHLSADHANLLRLRNSVASYVEQRAAVVDPKGGSAFGGGAVTASAKKPDAHHARKSVTKKKVVLRSSR